MKRFVETHFSTAALTAPSPPLRNFSTSRLRRPPQSWPSARPPASPPPPPPAWAACTLTSSAARTLRRPGRRRRAWCCPADLCWKAFDKWIKFPFSIFNWYTWLINLRAWFIKVAWFKTWRTQIFQIFKYALCRFKGAREDILKLNTVVDIGYFYLYILALLNPLDHKVLCCERRVSHRRICLKLGTRQKLIFNLAFGQFIFNLAFGQSITNVLTLSVLIKLFVNV